MGTVGARDEESSAAKALIGAGEGPPRLARPFSTAVRRRRVLNGAEIDEFDEYGEPAGTGRYRQALNALVRSRIDEQIEKQFSEHVAPRVDDLLANLEIKETNRFGEGPKSYTIREWIDKRASEYLLEKVDYQGKSKSESRDSYQWKGACPRAVSIVRQFFYSQMEENIKEAVQNANDQIAGGIEGFVVEALKDLQKKLKVSVKA